MQVEIRQLREEDIEALVRIEEESFSMPWSAKSFRELLISPCCSYLVALADGQVVGGAGYTSLGDEVDIDNVVVSKKYRNQGIGQSLLRELIDRCEADQVEAFTLEVRVSNEAAIHMYEKYGFRSEGIRPRFYEKPTEDAMIMWRRKKVN